VVLLTLSQIPWYQLFQRATQSLSDAHRCSEQHIDLSRLDPLNVADVQIGFFCEPLLGDALGHALATNVVAQLFEPRRVGLGFWHAQLV
jgi:hypothetical protein